MTKTFSFYFMPFAPLVISNESEPSFFVGLISAVSHSRRSSTPFRLPPKTPCNRNAVLAIVLLCAGVVEATVLAKVLTGLSALAIDHGGVDATCVYAAQVLLFCGALLLRYAVHFDLSPAQLVYQLGLCGSAWSSCWKGALLKVALMCSILIATSSTTYTSLAECPKLRERIMRRVITAPIREELVYRGVLLALALRRGLSTSAATLVCSLAFATVHLTSELSLFDNTRQFIVLFVSARAFSRLTLASSSLWPALLLHATNNACAICAPLSSTSSLSSLILTLLRLTSLFLLF